MSAEVCCLLKLSLASLDRRRRSIMDDAGPQCCSIGTRSVNSGAASPEYTSVCNTNKRPAKVFLKRAQFKGKDARAYACRPAASGNSQFRIILADTIRNSPSFHLPISIWMSSVRVKSGCSDLGVMEDKGLAE
jgi:hypothetical protein